MKLVLCEKPSVGNTVAKVLGVKSRKDGYIECKDYIVSWCVGHLVGLAMPEEYGKEYKKWDKLPILPTEWKYNILPGTKKQFDVIRKLMNRKDVTGIVCATDAGREGELIFRLVFKFILTEAGEEHIRLAKKNSDIYICFSNSEISNFATKWYGVLKSYKSGDIDERMYKSCVNIYFED